MLQQLREKALALSQSVVTIQNKAAAEKRDLSADERTKCNETLLNFAQVLSDIEIAKKSEEAVELMAKLTPRKTEGLVPVGAEVINPEDLKNNWGFKGWRDLLDAARFDTGRLRMAQSTYSNEGTNADGGYALPPDFRPGIIKLLDFKPQLFNLFDQLQTPNLTVTLPTDEDPPWSASGIAVAATSEGAAITPTKPVLNQLVETLTKTSGLVHVTAEMQADGTMIASYVPGKLADKLAYNLDTKAFTAITGAGSKITVTSTASGVGAAANMTDLLAMYARLYVPFTDDSVWIMNTSYRSVLPTLVIGQYPVYVPAGGLSGKPFDTFLGRPIIWDNHTAAQGTVNDVLLISPSQFFGVKHVGGAQAAVSVDFAFDQELTSYRLSLRSIAKSKFSAVITKPDSTTCSNVVALSTRS